MSHVFFIKLKITLIKYAYLGILIDAITLYKKFKKGMRIQDDSCLAWEKVRR